MKYIILVGDGMADYPLEALGGRTPLQVAKKPNMDLLAREGKCGLLRTVPEGMKPGSDVANLSIMGYDPAKYYPGGRGPIEAASMGIEVSPKDLAFRCNIITEQDGIIKDYSADKITNKDGKALIDIAKKNFGSDKVAFFPGISYRNLMVLRDSDLNPEDFECDAPHDHMGEPVGKHLVKGRGNAQETAERMNCWMLKSREVFEKHKINQERKRKGRPLANMLWFWGPGRLIPFPSIPEKFGKSGVVISGVDLIKGLGKLAGLDIIDVPGATAYFDTNFEGKADAALDALNGGKDIAFIHIEAPDEAGHEGMLDEKIEAIENIDKRTLGRILRKVKGEDIKIGLLADHPTPIKFRTHVADPVPFAIYDSTDGKDAVKRYDEVAAKRGEYGLREGTEFVELLLK